LDYIVNCNYIGGTCLLPPIDAKIAESDGDEMKYDACYSTHLLQPYQRQFIASLIGYLFRGLGDINVLSLDNVVYNGARVGLNCSYRFRK
jgi:hypothetical protein